MRATQGSTQADEPNLDIEIGRRVHQMMWDKKITQTAFAEMIHMDQSAVAKRLRGKLGWSAKNLVAAASALSTTVAYLVGETENPRPSNPDGGGVRPEGLEPPTLSV